MLDNTKDIKHHLLPPATKLGQGNIFRSVCQEFCSRGGGLPHCLLGYTPRDQRQAPPTPGPEAGTPHPRTRGRHPSGPQAGTPARGRPPQTRGRHPPAQCMLGDTSNKWAVRILLECNLVCFYFQKIKSVFILVTTTALFLPSN